MLNTPQNSWDKVQQWHQSKHLNNNLSSQNNNSLFEALIADDNTNTKKTNSLSNILNDENASNYGNLFKNLINKNSNSNSELPTSAIINGVKSFVNNDGATGSAITNSINGLNGSDSAIKDAILSDTASNSGGLFSKLSNNGGGTPWGLIGGIAKHGYNALTGQTDKDYSDVEESVVYPLQGASMGASLGPIGAIGGALYGLGYSLKDDIGLKDSNFFTKTLFPIDLGNDYKDWF